MSRSISLSHSSMENDLIFYLFFYLWRWANCFSFPWSKFHISLSSKSTLWKWMNLSFFHNWYSSITLWWKVIQSLLSFSLSECEWLIFLPLMYTFYSSHSLPPHLSSQIYALKVSEFFSLFRFIFSLTLFNGKQPYLLFLSFSLKVSKPFSFPWPKLLIFLSFRSMLWKWVDLSLSQI